VFWLGLAWIALMWMLILPLDRWIFQGLMGMSMDLSGKLAISNALFWTVSTLSAIWRFFGIPFLSGC
jgi:Ca-activated chloride channel family protein